MTKKIIGQGAGQFAPTSQFEFLNELAKPMKPPASELQAPMQPKAPDTPEEPGFQAPEAAKSASYQTNKFVKSEKRKESTTTAYLMDRQIVQELRVYAVNHRISASKIVNDLVAGFLAGQRKK
jgi:hypothetical protein